MSRLELGGSHPSIRELYVDGTPLPGTECFLCGNASILSFRDPKSVSVLQSVEAEFPPEIATLEIIIPATSSASNNPSTIVCDLGTRSVVASYRLKLTGRQVYSQTASQSISNVVSLYDNLALSFARQAGYRGEAFLAGYRDDDDDAGHSGLLSETGMSFSIAYRPDSVSFRVHAAFPTGAIVASALLKFVSGIMDCVESSIERTIFQTEPDEAIDLYFRFPAETKAACLQYLSYFGQFLRDLDIDASTDLSEQAGQVLFSVVPKAGPDALDAIRKALNIYLELPAESDHKAVLVPTDNIAALQLMSNVQHLQSQLSLAQAILEAKDATIQAKQQQIALLTSEIDKQIERQQPAIKIKSEEPLLGGLVVLQEYQGKGWKVDLPKLFRALTRRG